MYVPSEEKVYFFFSEIGKEFDFIDKFTVPRVAQVCTVSIVFDAFVVYVFAVIEFKYKICLI